MDYIIIEGVPPYDGRYDFDLLTDGTSLRGYELSWIKRFAGYLVVDIDDKAFGDHELIQVLAAIALCRAGRVSEDEVPGLYERFQHAEFEGLIRMELGAKETETDASPPSKSSESGNASGPDSKTSSATSHGTPVSGGTPALATTESVPLRSAG